MKHSTDYMPLSCPKVYRIFDKAEADVQALITRESKQTRWNIKQVLYWAVEQLKENVTYKFRDALDAAIRDGYQAEAALINQRHETAAVQNKLDATVARLEMYEVLFVSPADALLAHTALKEKNARKFTWEKDDLEITVQPHE